VVGAISFAPDEVERGRGAMREIVQELSTTGNSTPAPDSAKNVRQ